MSGATRPATAIRVEDIGLPHGNPVIEAFERERAGLIRRKTWIYTFALLGLALLVSWAFRTAGFGSADIGQHTLMKIGDFLVRMNPDLRLDRLWADTSVDGSLAHWYNRWPQWRDAMIETVEMTLVSTLFSAVFGLLAGILSARTTMPVFAVRWVVKRFMELIRTVPDLILAIIFVALFGLGPLAGILTLSLSGIGLFGRYIGEALENIDRRPREAIRAVGGGPIEQIRYGVFPQISPIVTSFTFLRIEMGIASATTLGLVGAGGIGVELSRALEFNQYDSYLAILILIVFVIMIADLGSEHVRHRLSRERVIL